MKSVRIGSVVIEIKADGNMRIAMSHTPNNEIKIERADVDDLDIALSNARRMWLRMEIDRLKDENARLLADRAKK